MEREEELRTLVKECNSFHEMFKKMGKVSSGASLKRLKAELELYGIDYKFVPEKVGGIRATIPLEDVLKENVTYCSKDLKRRLIKAGIKKDICEQCGIGPSWNGKPLTLHLDHINGVHTDNRIENLRILCPNCHSQTDTFAGRNSKRIKQIRKCVDCGKELRGRRSIRCYSCAAKFRAYEEGKVVRKPSREELLLLLKNNTVAEVARICNVTFSAVRKWCIRYDIPHTKKELGKYLESV